MYPAGLVPAAGDGPDRISCAGVYTTAARPAVLEVLRAIGFSGWVGPVQSRWMLVVADNPLGKVAAGRRMIIDLALEVAAGTGALTLGAQVRRDESLGLWLFEGDRQLAAVDTAPPDPEDFDAESLQLDAFGEPVVDAFGEPVLDASVGAAAMSDDDEEPEHAPLARGLGRPEVAEEVTELLEEELSEDESESERLTALARLVGLPTWLVAADSLPRDVPNGPSRREVLRLRAGRTGAAGWVPGYLTRRFTRRPPKPPDRR